MATIYRPNHTAKITIGPGQLNSFIRCGRLNGKQQNRCSKQSVFVKTKGYMLVANHRLKIFSRFLYIMAMTAMLLTGCHKKTGKTDIETSSSPGKKTTETTRPENLGVDINKNHKAKNSDAKGSGGGKPAEGPANNASGQ
jgi:hypothetical protein